VKAGSQEIKRTAMLRPFLPGLLQRNVGQSTARVSEFPPPHSAVEGDWKNKIQLILEVGHGVIIEDDLVIQPDIHLRGIAGFPVEFSVSEIPDLIIGGVQMSFLNFDQFGEHTPSPM
jgi:hypothetical protein